MKTLLKISLLIIMSLGLNIQTKAEVETKKVTQTFPACSNLKIDTRHSRVELKSWDKNKIKLDVLISVESNKADQIQTILNNINIDITKGDDLIVSKTVFGDFFSLKKLSNSIFNKGQIKIDYIVYLPSETQLDLVQKNSRIFITNHSGNIKLDLSDCEFTAENLSGKNDFELKSNSLLKIKEINEARINITRSTVDIEVANKITGDSHDSKYKLGSINNMNVRSARDKFEIKKIEALYGASSLSKFDINYLGHEINYDISFGYLYVYNIDYMFDFIKLDSKFGNLGLSFNSNANFNYEINHRAVKFDKTSAFDLDKNKTVDEKVTISKGRFGSKEAISKVNIRANNCKLKLE